MGLKMKVALATSTAPAAIGRRSHSHPSASKLAPPLRQGRSLSHALRVAIRRCRQRAKMKVESGLRFFALLKMTASRCLCTVGADRCVCPKISKMKFRLSRNFVWVDKIFAVVMKKRSLVATLCRDDNCAMTSRGNLFNRHR